MLHDEKCCECRQMTDGTAQYVCNYHSCFVPERWGLEYPSLDHPGKAWNFYLLGRCQYCRRSMRYNRGEINAKIESLGAHAGSSVSSKTDYLICGENAGSKLDKARQLGIPVLSPAEFFLMADCA